MLETVLKGEVSKATRRSGRTPGEPGLRRELAEDFAPRRRSVAAAALARDAAEDEAEQDFRPRRRMVGGWKLKVANGIPRSVLGRVAAGVAVFGVIGGLGAALWQARAQLLHDPRLVLPASSDVEIAGNRHLTRAQLLTVFGEDVDRNILTVPLAERRAELERLPWVEHATVMRLLPNRFRVAIVERKPVAFVRQGSHIGLVDKSGVLLDMASNGDAGGAAAVEEHYSFPVVTGITADEPMSTRGPRMKLFSRFMTELGDKSRTVSEVDLSNPEDVKALIPDQAGAAAGDVLVHFGSEDFLHRYDLYQKNLSGWRKEFPHLASADMRYDRQVVLEMQPGSAVPLNESALPKAEDGPAPGVAHRPAAKLVKVAKAAAKPAPRPVVAHKVVPGQHLTQAFDVPRKAVKPQKPGVTR